MKKRMVTVCMLAMSMIFTACGSKASTEVEQEDIAAVQEDTPQEEEPQQEETVTGEDATVTPEATPEASDEGTDTTESAQEEDAESSDTEIPQDVTPVKAQYQVYAGVYYDMNIYEATAEGGASDSYCQIEVSNVTDQSFDFAVYQLTDGDKKTVLDTRTAVFVEDGTKAVSEKDGTNLVFTFPDNWSALPKVVEMQVSGLDVLEGNSYVNNSVPGYEFG